MSASSQSASASSEDARTVLDSLPVKGRAPKTGYDREKFPHWVDLNDDGCDSDIDAIRAWANVEMAGKCDVAAAQLVDPYSGETLSWNGPRANVVDIDHVVALSNAWQTGAQQFDVEKRTGIANDPLSLIPVDAGLNRQKGDSDAASWLPPNKDFRCAYVARQVAVKKKYSLWVTSSEKDAITRVLEGCSGEKVPTEGEVSTVSGKTGSNKTPDSAAPSATRTSSTSGRSSEKSTSSSISEPKTCAEVKAAGKGPFRKGKDAEYAKYRDADGDGVVCE